MKNFEINKVATCGCEITNENNQIIGWSIDSKWGIIMTKALLLYFQQEKENEKYNITKFANSQRIS